jgi:hypothetical protein
MSSGFRKIDWTWTRQGWKRIPRRLQTVKLVPVPRKKRKALELHRINLASPKLCWISGRGRIATGCITPV